MRLSTVILFLVLFKISNNERKYQSLHVRESGFRNPGIFVGGILDFGIQNTAQGVRDPNNYWNPKFKFH